MDLMKLLRLKKSGESANPNVWESNPASSYFQQLAHLLRHDIKTLAASEGQEEWMRLSRVMKVYTGNLAENSDPEKDGYNYLFLNVPSKRGMMLELNSEGTAIELRYGTLIVPLKRNTFDELEQTTLFVTTPRLLASYNVIGPDVVRQPKPVKTFTVELMSEWLLSLAFGLAEPEADLVSELNQSSNAASEGQVAEFESGVQKKDYDINSEGIWTGKGERIKKSN